MWWPLIMFIGFLVALWLFWRFFRDDMEHLDE